MQPPVTTDGITRVQEYQKYYKFINKLEKLQSSASERSQYEQKCRLSLPQARIGFMYRVYIGPIYRSDRIVAHTVIQNDDLDQLLCV